jgi:hypothetical protein
MSRREAVKCPTRVDTFSVRVSVYHEMTTLILTEQKVNTTGDNSPKRYVYMRKRHA